MSAEAWAAAPPEDRHHFMDCCTCGEPIDCRDLDEVFFHEDHQPKPDIPYTGVTTP